MHPRLFCWVFIVVNLLSEGFGDAVHILVAHMISIQICKFENLESVLKAQEEASMIEQHFFKMSDVTQVSQ